MCSNLSRNTSTQLWWPTKMTKFSFFLFFFLVRFSHLQKWKPIYVVVKYRLVQLPRDSQFPAPVIECRRICAGLGMRLLVVGNLEEDLRGLSRRPEYKDELIIITDGREELDPSGRSTVYGYFESKRAINIPFYKTNDRAKNRPGTYAINIYYRAYLSRAPVVDRNDWCACISG